MNSILTVIVAYAVVFAPGCKQRTSSNLHTNHNQDFIDQMHDQLNEREQDAFKAVLSKRTESLRHFNVYASFDKKTIKKVSAEILKDFTGDKPLLDKNGNIVSHLFVQSKAKPRASILVVRYIADLKNNQRAMIIVERSKLAARSGLKNTSDLRNYTTSDFIRIKAVPVKMDLKENDRQKIRDGVTTNAQQLRLMLANFSQEASPSQQGYGLQTEASYNKSSVFLGAILGFVMIVAGLAIAAKLGFSPWDKTHDGDILVPVAIVCGLLIAFFGAGVLANAWEALPE